MAEENPSSEAPKPEKDDTDRGRSPRVPDPSPKSESSSPPPDRTPSTHPSPSPPPATGVTTETLAAPNPSTQPAAAPAADGRSFSQLLAGAMASPVGSPRAAAPILAVPVDAVRLSGVAVPCFLAPLALLEPPGFTGQFAMTHQAVLASVTAQARIQMQAAHPSPEILTSSFPQPVLTAISPVPLQQRQPHVPEDNVCIPEAEQSDSSVQKPHPAQVVANTNSGGDGYNWRKYGQKQVKSGENYRSYYKCTDGSCSAKKKVERFPDGRVTEVMYRGQHNHDPPQQTRCLRVKGARFGVPVGENASLDLQSSEINESDPSISTTDKNSGNEMTEQQLFCSSDCEGDAGIKIEEDLRDEPDPKRRLSESTITCSTPPLKTFREMKIVVHTACDMGPSTDGYKWRKYGQKIVKGNPNPRSYYRCTHTGCPVRKHVERASDDAKAIVMTYEGTHNHAMPGPRSSSDPPASPLPTAAAAASTTGEQLHTPDSSLERKPSTDSPPDLDREAISEKALELGGENALLGIGLKSSAGVDGGGTESEGMKCTRFDENRAAVAVQNS